MVRTTILLGLCIFIYGACKSLDQAPSNVKRSNKVTFLEKEAERKIDVFIDGQLFTSYRYPENIAKPILYPILSVSGTPLTRGFPIDPVLGERADHPHHIGYWLNYGDVNGLDFWNNSDARPPEKKHKYGTIFHQKVLNLNEEEGTLTIEALWKTPSGVALLSENTTFTFSQQGNTRIIDRATTLKALQDVDFKDNKEGMVAIRVVRALELPSPKPAFFIAENGKVAPEKAVSNDGVTGDYLSSTGKKGNQVWGTRAKWMHLHGEINEKKVSLTLIDHPDNVGYPTYWHARGYGLFSANPLGQEVFSKGKEKLNFRLAQGASTTFKYRLLINEDLVSEEQIESHFSNFSKKY